jgi:hypothetical protein
MTMSRILPLCALLLGGCMGTPAPPPLLPDLPPIDPPGLAAYVCDGGVRITVRHSDETPTLTDPQGVVVHLRREGGGPGFHYRGQGHDVQGEGLEMIWTSPVGARLGCKSAWDPLNPPLAGSRWRLQRIVSGGRMEALHAEDLSAYVLEFHADHTLFAELGCDRVAGRWEGRPWSMGKGSLSLTGLAVTTRAACPPAPLDARIAADLGLVRSYSADGQALDLMSSGLQWFYSWRADAREEGSGLAR